MSTATTGTTTCDRCIGTTKRGTPCHRAAEAERPWCLLHDPERVEERRALMASNGRSGQAKRAARERGERATIAASPVALDTTAAIRSAIERALASVEACEPSAHTRAHAVSRLATVALDIVRTSDLESELARLRELIVEHWPEAAGRLGRMDA